VKNYFKAQNEAEKIVEVLKPSANLGTKVDGGTSGATSQLTEICLKE
jgi:hypothetical protein